MAAIWYSTTKGFPWNPSRIQGLDWLMEIGIIPETLCDASSNCNVILTMYFGGKSQLLVIIPFHLEIEAPLYFDCRLNSHAPSLFSLEIINQPLTAVWQPGVLQFPRARLVIFALAPEFAFWNFGRNTLNEMRDGCEWWQCGWKGKGERSNQRYFDSNILNSD